MTVQQQDDVAFINNPNQWVHWPYLPVKNSRRKKPDGFPLLGIVVESSGKVLPTVFLANLFELPSKTRLSDMEKVEYDNVGDLVADGWIVD